MGSISSASSPTPKSARTKTLSMAARHLDPSLVDVLRILGFDKEYASAKGSYVYDADGRAYLDFHTGEGFASLGHNHPDVRGVLRATLAADLVDGVQIHYSPLAGMLAEALSQRLPDGLDATLFASTGAEAVDAAMKFARAATGRPRLISCESGFHGVTLGPRSGRAPGPAGCKRRPARSASQGRNERRGAQGVAGLPPSDRGDVGRGARRGHLARRHT
jgi:4-aminobutyrate aminotransferase-like enzyme